MKKLLFLTYIFLIGCGTNQNVKTNKVVALGINDEVYSIDKAASLALNNKDETNKIICRKTKKTGSNISSKTCTTKAQSDAARELQQEKLRDEQNRQRRILFRMREPSDG